MTPAPISTDGHARLSDRPSDGYIGSGGQLFQFDDFGCDLHNSGLCVHAQLMSSGNLCVGSKCVVAHSRAILRPMAKRTATERDEEYKKQVSAYLLAVHVGRQWSQSEIARRMGAHPSSANKAFHGKHALEYAKIMVLAEQSGVPIPDSLTEAYKALAAPRPPAATELSPAMKRLIELERRLREADDQKDRLAIKRQMAALIDKVA